MQEEDRPDLFEDVSYFLEDECARFEFKDTSKMNLFPKVTHKQILFVMNTMRQSARQRREGGPTTLFDTAVPMALEKRSANMENEPKAVKVL